MKALLIDNFDSFVYNIYQGLCGLGHEVDVYRNDAITLSEIKRAGYGSIIISPGPGDPTNPRDFGISGKVIATLGRSTPILGICLGHQGIISAFGGRIVRAEKPMHGKTSAIKHDGRGLFKGVRNPLRVMRYHSLIGKESSLPGCLEVTAMSEDDKAIMAVRHKSLDIFGVQFHPESVLAEQGMLMLKNFMEYA
jgi:anthranilate synthase component 2